MLTVALGLTMFTGIIVLLVSALLVARRTLIDVGEVEIQINQADSRTLRVAGGRTLLASLSAENVLLPSACGGKGTCGTCAVQVLEGGGPAPLTEVSVLGRGAVRRGTRLACQLKVRRNLRITLPQEVLDVRRLRCRVRSNRNVATFIKELVLELPDGDQLPMRAGDYIQAECPAYQVGYDTLEIEAPFATEWAKHGLRRLRASCDEPTERAYSMANYPVERDVILNVRIALPPPDAPDAPPGIVSSYLFSLRPGDEVTISGPYGNFYARDTDKEMCFIGGGAGMAPLRSHVLDQLLRLRTQRKITFWYGARNLQEAFYVEELQRLAQEHDNFEWHLALSEPLADDHWQGPAGFIHQVLFDEYLSRHPCPENVEYYLCGPPAMLDASRKMLDDLGVSADDVLFDDFGQ